VSIAGPYAHLDIPIIGQTYIFFRGTLAPPFTFSPGPESHEVAMFSPEEIPFDHLAFSSVYMTLEQWVSDKTQGVYTLQHGVIRKKAGASPFDPNAYEYKDSYEVVVREEAVRR
jgi:ADP-ribose/FAD diphosphatase